MKKFYLFREPLAMIIFFGGLAIALFSPIDVLDRLPWVRYLSIPLSELLPPIRFYVEKSKFPQVAELYFTAMWILSPLAFYWFGRDLSRELALAVEWKKKPLVVGVGSAIGLALLLVVILPSTILTCLYFNDGNEFSWLPIHRSRIALGFGGYFIAGTAGWYALQFEILFIRKLIFDVKHNRSSKI